MKVIKVENLEVLGSKMHNLEENESKKIKGGGGANSTTRRSLGITHYCQVNPNASICQVIGKIL